MIDALARFGVSCVLSYRALFTWLNPYGYLSSRIAFPVFVAVLFALVADGAGRDTIRPIVGGTLLAVALAVCFGMALAVGNERQFGTLSAWLAAPEGLMASLLGKASIHLIDGLIGASLTLTVSAIAFDVSVSPTQALELSVVVATVVLSTLGAATLVAAAVVRWRDTFTPPNLVVQLLMLFSGALVAVEELPFDAAWLSPVLPLTHAVDAGLSVMDGDGLVVGPLLWEVAVGAAWGALGYAALRVTLHRARVHGSLEVS